MQNTYAARQPVTSVYIHVPFCLKKCDYCDFYSTIFNQTAVDRWQEGILKEISLLKEKADKAEFNAGKIKTIYFGGGTPSLLPPFIYQQQLDLLEKTFGLDPAAEITLEANPGVLHSFSSYRQIGINRISFGLQTASDRLLQLLGRNGSADIFKRDILRASQAGFTRISADLMIGLPEQKFADLEEAISLLLSLPINHISYYSLTLAEGTKFWPRYKDSDLLPSDDLEREMYHYLLARLKEEDIWPYEISNASKRGEESLHNQVYWRADSYMGLGPAAHSYLGGIRAANPPSLTKWLGLLAEGKSSFFEIESIDEDKARIESIILGLRMLSGVNFSDFYQRHQIDLNQLFAAQIEKLKARNLLTVDETGIRLSSLGLDLANQVWLEFI